MQICADKTEESVMWIKYNIDAGKPQFPVWSPACSTHRSPSLARSRESQLNVFVPGWRWTANKAKGCNRETVTEPGEYVMLLAVFQFYKQKLLKVKFDKDSSLLVVNCFIRETCFHFSILKLKIPFPNQRNISKSYGDNAKNIKREFWCQ